MFPQDQIGDAVKCPAPDAVDILRSGQRFDPLEHFSGGAVRKGRQQNSIGRNALFKQVSDAIGDRPRLSRSEFDRHAANDSELRYLRDSFRRGIPRQWGDNERTDAARLFEILGRVGGTRLVGEKATLAPGTFSPPKCAAMV